ATLRGIRLRCAAVGGAGRIQQLANLLLCPPVPALVGGHEEVAGDVTDRQDLKKPIISGISHQASHCSRIRSYMDPAAPTTAVDGRPHGFRSTYEEQDHGPTHSDMGEATRVCGRGPGAARESRRLAPTPLNRCAISQRM